MPIDSEHIKETTRWIITTDNINFEKHKNDKSFWYIVALGRALNALFFVHQALVAHKEGDDSPAAIRARHNSIFFSCAIYYEIHLLVQHMGKHFSDLPEFKRLSELFNDKKSRKILDGDINTLRNSFVFHFNPSGIGRQLQGADTENPIFLWGQGKTNGQTYFALADLCAFRTLHGSSFPTSVDLSAFNDFNEMFTSLIDDFSIIAQELIVEVLNTHGWHKEVLPE